MTDATPVDMVDLQFVVRGRAVPLDYADLLWQAVGSVLPWLEGEPLAGIHPLYGLSPGRGEWYLSRRSHLDLRLPRERVTDARALVDARLDLGGTGIEIGAMSEKAFTHTPVLYSHFVAFEPLADELPDEAVFFQTVRAELNRLELVPRSVVCGKRKRAQTPAGILQGFSLMVTGLDEAQNQRLLSHGLGIGRKCGCGIFIPHKSNPADGSL